MLSENAIGARLVFAGFHGDRSTIEEIMKRKILWSAVVLGCLSVPVGCGGGGNSAAVAPPPAPTPSAPTPTPSANTAAEPPSSPSGTAANTSNLGVGSEDEMSSGRGSGPVEGMATSGSAGGMVNSGGGSSSADMVNSGGGAVSNSGGGSSADMVNSGGGFALGGSQEQMANSGGQPVQSGGGAGVGSVPKGRSNAAASNLAPGSEMESSSGGGVGSLPGFGGNNTQAPPPPPRKLTLRERAEDAFKKGHEKEAYALIQGHILASESEAAEYMERMRWSPMRKQPQIGCRIAVGVALKAPPQLTSYNPINVLGGNNQNAGGLGSGEMEGFGSGMGKPSGSSGGTGGGNKGLVDITGDMGRLLIDHVKELFESGSLGSSFTNLELAGATSNAGGGVSGFGAGAGSEGVSLGDSEPSMVGSSGGGMSAPGLGMGPGGGMAGGGMAGGRQTTQPITGKLATPNRNRLTPGLTYLGTDEINDLIDKSLAEGYDLLVVYEVTVEQNRRGGNILNDCRARLYKPGEKKTLISTESFNNSDVMRKMQKGESNILEKGMSKLFAKLDEVSLADIPSAVNESAIQNRASALVANKTRGAIESMAELRFWNHRKLLGDAELEKAYASLSSADVATKLLSGTEEERVEALKKYLP